MRLFLLLHILSGGLGIFSGAVALGAAKGGLLHRRSGIVFTISMLMVSLTGAVVAVWLGIEANAIGGLLAAYLVATALTTVRPRGSGSPRLDLLLLLVAVAIGGASITMASQALAIGARHRDGIPVPMLFFFGAVSLRAAFSDFRMMRSGGVHGPRRLARHLWRMCFALFIATGSFFLGQADKLPASLRIYPLLGILAIAPLLIMIYWLWRVRIRRSASRIEAETHTTP